MFIPHFLFCSLQNPSLNFKEVTYELDHPGFQIRDSKGLQIVVYGVQRGLGLEVFPVDLIYRPWKHAEGQVTRQLLRTPFPPPCRFSLQRFSTLFAQQNLTIAFLA